MKSPYAINTLLQVAQGNSANQNLQESIFSPAQEKLKNKKFPSLQKNKTSQPHSPRQTDTDFHGGQLKTQYLQSFRADTDDRKTEALGGNTGFAKAGVQCFVGQESSKSNFVLRSKVSAEKPHLRQARKRWRSL